MSQPPPRPAEDADRLGARLSFLRRRAQLVQAVRAFFAARGYIEVETPYAVRTPGRKSICAPSPPSARRRTAGGSLCSSIPARSSP